MLNNQPPEKRDFRDDGSLDIIDVFQTVQGEGPFAGCPAVFLRLAGCDLQCPACDTSYTKGRERRSVLDILNEVHNEAGDVINLVVLTGGEPLRQNLVPLLNQLAGRYEVQIETNGTLPVPETDYIGELVCSPKTAKIHDSIMEWATAWKYIVEHGKIDKDGLPTSSLGMNQKPCRPPQLFDKHQIYVQPMDAQDPTENQRNLDAAVEACRKHGFRLSLQQHKLLELP